MFNKSLFSRDLLPRPFSVAVVSPRTTPPPPTPQWLMLSSIRSLSRVLLTSKTAVHRDFFFCRNYSDWFIAAVTKEISRLLARGHHYHSKDSPSRRTRHLGLHRKDKLCVSYWSHTHRDTHTQGAAIEGQQCEALTEKLSILERNHHCHRLSSVEAGSDDIITTGTGSLSGHDIIHCVCACVCDFFLGLKLIYIFCIFTTFQLVFCPPNAPAFLSFFICF